MSSASRSPKRSPEGAIFRETAIFYLSDLGEGFFEHTNGSVAWPVGSLMEYAVVFYLHQTTILSPQRRENGLIFPVGTEFVL